MTTPTTPATLLAAQHPVWCAWCPLAGRETLVGCSTVAGSHGICRACADAMLAEHRAKR